MPQVWQKDGGRKGKKKENIDATAQRWAGKCLVTCSLGPDL